LQQKRKDQEETLKEAKEKAESFVKLMDPAVARKREEEEAKGGLIIQHARYGRLPQSMEVCDGPDPGIAGINLVSSGRAQDGRGRGRRESVCDRRHRAAAVLGGELATAPASWIQGTLIIRQVNNTDTSQAGLVGFYDPCPGEEKHLEVIYLFRNKLHRVCIADDELLRVPLQCK
jgi:DnaJ family protein C protein 11